VVTASTAVVAFATVITTFATTMVATTAVSTRSAAAARATDAAAGRGIPDRAAASRSIRNSACCASSACATRGPGRVAAAAATSRSPSALASFGNRTNPAVGPIPDRGGTTARSRCANGAARAAWHGTKPANGSRDLARPIRSPVGIVQGLSAQGLRENGAPADLLAADNAEAAIAVHRRIGDGRHALLHRPSGLGEGCG
jgi:hypothetical protein